MRTAKAILVGWTFTCLLAAPVRGGEPPASLRGCTSLDATAHPANAGPSKGHFSATRILNIAFTATLVPSSDADALEAGVLTITTPKGYVYQEIDVPIGTLGEAGKREKTRKVQGFPHPVPVTHPVPNARLGNLVLPLPALLVGGTSIQDNGLYGKWEAEFRLRDGSRPCRVSFKITP